MYVQNLNKLSDFDWQNVRASSSIKDYRNIIEELVLNAIDANSTHIEIICDFTNFSLEVNDNGDGITSYDLSTLGKWNYTSKSQSNSSYGFKGEALAAISFISCVQISTMTRINNKATGIAIVNGDSRFIEPMERIGPGTTVKLSDIFESLPVRRNAIKPNIEIIKIKEFIQHMSVLHHKISWIFIDVSRNTIGLKRRIVFQAFSQRSVAAQFIKYHSSQIFIKMQECNVSNNYLKLHGLISPPFRKNCENSKEYQYMYINNRWIKGIDLVSSMINDLFKTYHKISKKPGPISRHFVPDETAYVYPCFVLQITCSHNEYDILSEPDKSIAIFQNENEIKNLVLKLFYSLLNQHDLQTPDSWPEEWLYSQKSAGMTVIHRTPDKSQPQESNSHESEKLNHFNRFYYIDSTPTKPSEFKASSFDEAFFQSSSLNNYLQTEENRPQRWNSCYTNQYVPVDDLIHHFNEAYDESSVDFNEPIVRVEAYQPGYDIERRCDQLCDSSQADLNLPLDDELLFKLNQSQSSNKLETDFVSTSDDRYLESGNDETINETTIVTPSKKSKYFPSNSLSDVSYDERFNVRGDDRSMIPVPINQVTREMIENCYVIGQVDRKFILVHSFPYNCLLAFDQHAVDERVKLETFQQLTQPKGLITQQVRFILGIDKLCDYIALNQRHSLFELWGFRYHFIPEEDSTTVDKFIRSKRKHSTDSHTMYLLGTCATVMLTQVPIIVNEALTDQDFMEFVRCVAENSDIPSSLCRPPSVERLLASKACRKAVKFGDYMDIHDQRDLIKSLSKSKLPFSCAHGRPSVVPINVSP